MLVIRKLPKRWRDRIELFERIGDCLDLRIPVPYLFGIAEHDEPMTKVPNGRQPMRDDKRADITAQHLREPVVNIAFRRGIEMACCLVDDHKGRTLDGSWPI